MRTHFYVILLFLVSFNLSCSEKECAEWELVPWTPPTNKEPLLQCWDPPKSWCTRATGIRTYACKQICCVFNDSCIPCGWQEMNWPGNSDEYNKAIHNPECKPFVESVGSAYLKCVKYKD